MKGVGSKHMYNFFEDNNQSVLTNIYNPISELDIFTFALVPLLRSLTVEKLTRIPKFIPQRLVEFLKELVTHPLFEPLEIQPGYIAAMARVFIELSAEAALEKYKDALMTSPLTHLRERFVRFVPTIILTPSG